MDKGDIIDLDDTNYDISDVKDQKLAKHKTHAIILDQDSDDTDIGPYNDLFDDVEVSKNDNAAIFRTGSNEVKLEDNASAIPRETDDEDISQGSGSGDTEIEIEENPNIFNTTDTIDDSGNFHCLVHVLVEFYIYIDICSNATVHEHFYPFSIAWKDMFCLAFDFKSNGLL